MDPKNPNSNIPKPSSNELPDLTPQIDPPAGSKQVFATNAQANNPAVPQAAAPVPSATVNPSVPTPSAPLPPSSPQPEVFINPNPPMATLNTSTPSGFVTSNNPLGVADDKIGYADQPNPGRGGFPNLTLPAVNLNKKLLLIIVFLVLVLGSGGFFLNEFVLNRISILKLVSQDAQFYLSLSVKKNPQAESAKSLLKKFPNGEKLVDQFNNYYAGIIGGQKDPLLDIAAYANSEVFLTQVSKTDDKNTLSNKLLSIVDVGDAKTAKGDVGDFEDDSKNYTTTTSTYKGNRVIEIKLKSEEALYKSASRSSSRSLVRQISTPKPLALHATAIDRFLVAARDHNDLTKTVDLSKTKTFLGFGNPSDPKSILDSKDHQEIARFFPEKTFLKYFQRQPITPGSSFPMVNTYSNSDTQAKTFQKQAVGIAAVASDNGFKIDSLVEDWFAPNESLTNGFSLSQSLANRLPKTFAGVSPTYYGEVNNVKALLEEEKKKNDALADSKNRSQRKQFEDYKTSSETGKKEFKKAYGLDQEKDLLDWMDGNVATIFNAGSSKKGPEFLLVADIKDKSSVENSLKKFSIPNYSVTTNDSKRKSDILDLQDSLSLYYSDNSRYPDTLAELKKSDPYLTIPTDPKTAQSYTYTVSVTKKGYTLSSNMEDGTTLVATQFSFSPTYTGTKKDTTDSPVGSDYQGSNIYKLKLYQYGTIVYSLYFVVTDKKAVIGLSDSDESLKNIVAFEKNGGENLTSNSVWKKQFSSINNPVGFLTFVEPIQVWGLVDYLNAQYPDYKKALETYSGNTSWDDIQTVAKAYLKTISSVGSVTKKSKPVFVSNTFVNIVELPRDEKQKAEDALDRLMKTDKSTSYKSVLGVSTQNVGVKFQKDWGKFSQIYLDPFFHPNF